MCGIAGALNIHVTEPVLKKMLSTMARRGPDDCNIFRDSEITLLHTRLAIIDPQMGKQPMELEFGGESYVIAYNGELYNTEELRSELVRYGHSFKGHSDTEVVLHAYAQWKDGCVYKFNGIFAFAVWESKCRRLFLARDRIGVKPLFYTYTEGAILFASEMKTILAHPDFPARLDQEGALQLLLLGPGRIPGSGVFDGIHELEPGYVGYCCGGKLSVKQYWKLTDREHTVSFEDTSAYVRYLVTDAIKRQMVSDVPIGTFLSGGLDSSIISAVCAEEMCSRGERLDTFSVDYYNNAAYYTANKFQPESDNAYIQIMQEKLNSNHHWTTLSPEDLSDALEASTRARDLPGMADVDFSLFAFCRDIRTQVKVALSGECADEIFGGYPWYRDPEIRDRAGFPWAQNTFLRSQLLTPVLAEGRNADDFVMDHYRATCSRCDILPGTSAEDRRTKEMVNLNFRWFMQTLLDRKDRMSMYHSLEVRVPFCDYRIAEYLYGVPLKYKDHHGQEKGLLRHAMQGILPNEILYRKKSPYPKTFDPGYERIMGKRINQLVESDSPVFELVSRYGLRDLLESNSPWPWYGQLMRRPQIMAYILQLDFWLKAYDVELLF